MDGPTTISFAPIEWEATEFEMHQKGWWWYASVIILAALVIAYAIYAKQWLFGVTVLILAGVILFVDRIRPRLLKCRIDTVGLSVNDKSFTYDQLKLFWFYSADGHTYLRLLSTNRMMPTISLSIPPDRLDSIQTTLLKVLPESTDRKDDMIDKLGRILKI